MIGDRPLEVRVPGSPYDGHTIVVPPRTRSVVVPGSADEWECKHWAVWNRVMVRDMDAQDPERLAVMIERLEATLPPHPAYATRRLIRRR